VCCVLCPKNEDKSRLSPLLRWCYQSLQVLLLGRVLTAARCSCRIIRTMLRLARDLQSSLLGSSFMLALHGGSP
jgi:hypothetical protein